MTEPEMRRIIDRYLKTEPKLPADFWAWDLAPRAVYAQKRLGEKIERPRQVDVLALLSSPTEKWVLPTDFLQEQGIRASATSEKTGFIEKYSPKIVLNRAFRLPHEEVRFLAARHPGVKWVTVNHSSQSDLFRVPRWPIQQAGFARLAKEYENCYYAQADINAPVVALTQHERHISLPHVVKTPPLHHRPHRQRLCVSLICVARALKNIPNQLLGFALAAKERPLSLLICTKDAPGGSIESLCETYEITPEYRPWQSWDEYIKMVATEVDIGLQVSFTESFNYVALEHMLTGAPVVGSDAIRYVPYWAGCDSPDCIANLIHQIADDIDHQRKVAIQIAQEVRDKHNAAFLKQIQRLFS